jgi:hypothetical protein
MATVQQIGRSISVAEDLGGVVGTMKGLAAVSVRQYERARESAQDYIDTLELGLQIVVRHNLELPKPRPLGRPVGIIIFGTEQGLCGPLNRHILEFAGRWIADEGIGARTAGSWPSARGSARRSGGSVSTPRHCSRIPVRCRAPPSGSRTSCCASTSGSPAA